MQELLLVWIYSGLICIIIVRVARLPHFETEVPFEAHITCGRPLDILCSGQCGLELSLALFELLGQLRVLLCKTLHST